MRISISRENARRAHTAYMERFPSFILIFGIIVMVFLLWQTYNPAETFHRNRAGQNNGELTPQERAERCEKFKETIPNEEEAWSVSYGTRFDQMMEECM